jgi:hypothetical protein
LRKIALTNFIDLPVSIKKKLAHTQRTISKLKNSKKNEQNKSQEKQ